MRSLLVKGCLLAVVAGACSSSPPAPVAPGAPHRQGQLATMRAGSQDEARAVLGRSDAFTRQMSPADRSFRTKQPLPVTEAALLSYAAAQAQSFTPDEVARVDRAIAALEAGLAKRNLAL